MRFEAVLDDIAGDDQWGEMLRVNAPGDVRRRFDAEFMRRAIPAFQRDGEIRNAFLSDAEARRMLMDLMFGRALRQANQAG